MHTLHLSCRCRSLPSRILGCCDASVFLRASKRIHGLLGLVVPDAPQVSSTTIRELVELRGEPQSDLDDHFCTFVVVNGLSSEPILNGSLAWRFAADPIFGRQRVRMLLRDRVLSVFHDRLVRFEHVGRLIRMHGPKLASKEYRTLIADRLLDDVDAHRIRLCRGIAFILNEAFTYSDAEIMAVAPRSLNYDP